MSRSPRTGASARWWAVLALALGACTEGIPTSGPDGPAAVATVSIGLSTRALIVGQTTQLTAIGKDIDGNIITDRVVTWISDAPLVASVTNQGLVTAHRVGTAAITADMDGRSSMVLFVVADIPVASVTVTPGVAALTIGGTRQLDAVVRDPAGNVLTDRAVRWSTSNASVVAVSATGLITASSPGFATITAESDTKQRLVGVTVCATSGLYVTGVFPAAFSPGGAGTIAGCNFAATPLANTVTVDGVKVIVESASPTELTVRMPDAAAYTCSPERATTLSVAAGSAVASRSHRWATALQHALAVGESVTLLDATDVRCNELVSAGGRYFISVFNTSGAAGVLTSVELRGLAGAPLAVGAAVAAAAPPTPQLRTTPSGGRTELGHERPALEGHAAILDANRDVVRTLGNPAMYRPRESAREGRPSTRSGSTIAPSLALSAAAPAVGETVPMRVWKHNSGSCNEYDEITTRTVYVGTRAIIREDAAAPLAGTMDDYFRALGEEFDATMFPVLAENFGNPLVLDAGLDANERIVIVFTKRVNDDGLAGFVISCDFYPRGVAPSSNEGEIFYAFLPTEPGTGYPSGLLTKDRWRREIRSTLIHEAKHITSFAERLSRNAPFEESWLEEGTAMHAEELWSRAVYGSAWKGNTTYETSLYCDVRQTRPECADSPYVMLSHFSLFYDYLASVETLTPFGRSTPGDYTFYGSAWAFLRWVIDHHSESDAAFLKPLTQSATVGIENITLRASTPFAELLADWSLAMAVDDYPGLLTSRPELSFPSWQTRDIFLAMSRDYEGFTRPVPLATRPTQFGSFTGALALRGGTAAIFELSGVQLATQLLELRTAAGVAPPTNMRMAIVRVQ